MPQNEARDTEPAAWPSGHEAPYDAAAELAGLPYVRLSQRRAPSSGSRNPWLLLALVVLAHVLLAWFAWLLLRPSFQHRVAGGVFSVTLLEPAAELPPPPPLLPPPPLPGESAPVATPRVHVPPAKGAISATLEGAKPLHLFDANGQISVVPQAPAATPAPAYSAAALHGSQIYNSPSPLPYKPTRFNKDWAPVNQSLGAKTVGRAFDKAVDKTTVKKVVKLPGGVKIQCAVSPLVLFFGCSGMPPQPPPKNDNDIRLSLPPAQTLTGKKVVVPSSASSVTPPPASGSH